MEIYRVVIKPVAGDVRISDMAFSQAIELVSHCERETRNKFFDGVWVTLSNGDAARVLKQL